ncbi:MAG: hypothetical protein CME32_19755 [Gimesia sp.]|nr:hypothetical protein [Gimesia sp.]
MREDTTFIFSQPRREFKLRLPAGRERMLFSSIVLAVHPVRETVKKLSDGPPLATNQIWKNPQNRSGLPGRTALLWNK